VRHTAAFMNTVGIHGAHLVGHSRGAYVALRVALEQPGIARSLTIVDSNSILTGGQRIAFYDRLTETEPPFGTRESAAQEACANSYSAAHVTDDWLDELVHLAALEGRAEAHAQYVKGGLRNDVFLPGFTSHREETLRWIEQGRLDRPTLVVWGLNDPSSPFEEHGLELLHYLANYVPALQMHVFNQAGHYCYREHPGAFVGLLSAFLNSTANA
jgi:pimeloyl-ACP methyl ester carboxylesterase